MAAYKGKPIRSNEELRLTSQITHVHFGWKNTVCNLRAVSPKVTSLLIGWGKWPSAKQDISNFRNVLLFR